ncbi:MAG TPA: UDP-4-amino-4,6-dideoxy-N-acetyl-beta-L-altrosamine transaminase [Atribacter sp.]|uniref:UDP-4-amino-4, 6-dideoxy-N-acetyl-beta-L-altrosamine transaminase n=1 Tax=Atribacter sp. TaxID=2847780 RepID=UPI002BB1BC3E|nr:UDP-4-amino-4,6-dideoxy-N-acetyl-beta-L-altrosamine transaminase [Atribacter sp.]HQK83203.1 UDP-4-amino-4,6-dideoxy-N-acetyl-beta-L-altrosamine transaminase [Atribacter sp.]
MQFIPYGHQLIDDQDILSVVDVLKSEWLTTGPAVNLFEQELCKYIGAQYAVAVNSGTSALDIAVQSLDLPKSSEIITTPFTFVATSNAILYNGHIPVFADINPNTRNINPEDIRKKITQKTRAIIYVDYAGHPCAIDEIKEIAQDNNLWLIEDACHAFGASYKKRKIGTFADMTVFSFHPVKPITTGEGGAVVTDDPKLTEKLRLLRNHGIDRNIKNMFGEGSHWAYDIVKLGKNYRMTDIQAALGASQLRKIDYFITLRNNLAKIYEELLGELPWLETPQCYDNIRHGWHLYTVLLNGINRNNLYYYLHKNNIGANVHYIPIYKFSYYQKRFQNVTWEFPATEDVFNRILTLPLHPAMTEQHVEYICEILNKAKSSL